MRPQGQAAIDAARADGRWDAAYAPQSKETVPPDMQQVLDANPASADFFATLTAAQRYSFLYRVYDAKRPANPGSQNRRLRRPAQPRRNPLRGYVVGRMLDCHLMRGTPSPMEGQGGADRDGDHGGAERQHENLPGALGVEDRNPSAGSDSGMASSIGGWGRPPREWPSNSRPSRCAGTVTEVSDIPNGVSTRWVNNSSYGVPAASASASPSSPTPMLEYRMPPPGARRGDSRVTSWRYSASLTAAHGSRRDNPRPKAASRRRSVPGTFGKPLRCVASSSSVAPDPATPDAARPGGGTAGRPATPRRTGASRPAALR